MNVMLSLQVLSNAVVVGVVVFVHIWVGEAVPPLRLLLFDIVYGGFALWWALSVAWLRLEGKIVEDTAEGWYAHSNQVFWFGNISTVAAFALVMPYVTEPVRLLVAMVSLAPVAVGSIGTVVTPRVGPRNIWAFLAPTPIPLSINVFFALAGDALAVPVIVFVTAFTAGLMLLREVIQGWVDEAWAAKRAAESARDARTRFLASASHDLGQPLQAAGLFFDQVVQSPEGPARDKAIRNVRWSLESTANLLNQILNHLRLESGGVEARSETVALGALIAGIAEMQEPASRLANLQISAVQTGLIARCDRILTERALNNLVSNVIRHAKAHRLLIGARRRQGQARIWVIDDGVGVPASDLPRLFEDHVQGSNHDEEIRGGFGLGLASTRRLAELMGGQAGHDPRWRQGSAFWIELPLA